MIKAAQFTRDSLLKHQLQLAEEYFEKQEYKTALQHYQKALQTDSLNQAAQNGKKAAADKIAYDQYIDDANALFVAGKHKEAKAKYQAALKLNKDGKEATNGIKQCKDVINNVSTSKPPPPSSPSSGTTTASSTNVTHNVSTPKNGDVINIKIPGTNQSIKMVQVQGGTFKMGCDEKRDGDCENNEKPHSVTLSAYSIGKYEVTIGQYLAFVKETKTHYPEWLETGSKYNIYTGSSSGYYKKAGMSESNVNHPITGVSWHDAKAYCDWLRKKTGKNFRLPTEAEWEYAARGGKDSKKHKYAGGNDIDKVAWYSGNSGGKTHEVGERNFNELGLYDMSGDVWEWCSDWYGSYPTAPTNNPKGPSNGTACVLRGGSWYNNARNCRTASRYSYAPSNRDSYYGFRPAHSLE